MKILKIIAALTPYIVVGPLYFLWFQAVYNVITPPHAFQKNYLDSKEILGYDELYPLIIFVLPVTIFGLTMFAITYGIEIKKRSFRLSPIFFVAIIGYLIIIGNMFMGGNGLTRLNPFDALNWWFD